MVRYLTRLMAATQFASAIVLLEAVVTGNVAPRQRASVTQWPVEFCKSQCTKF